MTSRQARDLLGRAGFADASEVAPSVKRFPDGSQFRVEIPSVEGPEVLEAVIDEADRRGVNFQRVSQGSGGSMLSRSELRTMAELGAERQLEVSLFARPTADWGIGAGPRSAAGSSTGAQVCGIDGLQHALAALLRTADNGIRGALLTDLGLLDVARQARDDGLLPRSFIFKGSVQMGLANPASVRLGERLGLDTYNVPSDLPLAQLAAIRAVTDMPLDIYLEAPDNLGGFVRYAEIGQIVKVAAPVYIKFGLRNSPDIYPSGLHLRAAAVAMARERVRRAEIALDLLADQYPDSIASAPGAAGLGIPVARQLTATA